MNPRHILPAALPLTALLLTTLPLAATPPTPTTAQPPRPTQPPTPDPTRDAYLDETARHLMLAARAAHDSTRQAIHTHAALVRERLSFDAPTGRHDRPWMRGERLLQARWSRAGPNSVNLIDEHFRHPGIGPSKARYFQGLRADHLPVDPLADPFTFGLAPFMRAGATHHAVHSPLGPGAESYYQFRSADTIELALKDGRTIPTIPVTAIPRYRSIRLVAAIMWIDLDTHGLVRVAYRPAKRIDQEVSGVLREPRGWWLGLDVTAGDNLPAPPDSQPGWFGRLINETFTAVLLGIETDISAVTVDFAPQSQMHWLPRRVQWTGYTGIESITATGSVVPTLPFVIDWTLEPARRTDGETTGTPEQQYTGENGTRQPSPDPAWDPARARADALRLGDTLAEIGDGEGGDRTRAASPWYLYPPIWTLNLMRYNPVEGVSIGAQVRRDFGWLRSVLTVRAATREWKEIPDIDLTLQRDRPGRRIQFSVYRALRTGLLGTGGIDGFPLPLILESDSLDFHWSTGAALRFLPGSGERLDLSVGVFAERDREVEGGDGRIRVGTETAWRPWWGGLGREAIGAGGTVSMRVAAGDRTYVRTMVEGALLLPLFARISLGLQAGAADVRGDPLPQDLWDLGTTGAWLRGHSAEGIETSGARMARADLQFPVRYARLSLFGDWASAEGEEYRAIGAGLVLLDGLLRMDVAQGLGEEREGSPEPALRFHVLLDNLF